MTAIIPDEQFSFTSNFTGYKKSGTDKFQIDFLSETLEIEPHMDLSYKSLIYTGAKELDLIDSYETNQNIPLFDRVVDFGWFYFITKPIYLLLKFFYTYLGNYGLAIIAITLLIKILMFPMANKSFKSMNKMKQLQPEVLRLKELYGSDQIKLNSEMMALYKKHNVNPLSGCLPIIIQIPVFFSLYKVIYISIDMRQATFYGWIKDLSLPDPTTITNLFGLLPFQPWPFLMIGILPILMALSMFIQQKLSPAPADPVQANVMKFLPLIFLFLFSSFPSGLLLYWTVSNIISIAQQYILLKTPDGNAKHK
jgi:YidC/Oxa1 family membrane protein insertase